MLTLCQAFTLTTNICIKKNLKTIQNERVVTIAFGIVFWDRIVPVFYFVNFGSFQVYRSKFEAARASSTVHIQPIQGKTGRYTN